jgi:hypothetical protein
VPKRYLGAIFLLVLAMPVAAQNTPTPDFTGTWVLNLAKSSLAKDSTLKSETIEIANKKSSIVFHYKTDGKKSVDTYTPDGQYRVVRDLGSGQLTSRASWQGSALIVESILQIKIPNVTVNVSGLKPVVDKWTLSPDGRTLTRQADDEKEVFVYDKQ